MSNEVYKIFGFVSMGMIWLAIGTLLFTWRGDKSMSISRHAAAHKKAFLFFGAVLIISAVLFVLFTIKWFIPELALPKISYAIVSVAGLLYIIGALVPDTKGLAHSVHYWASITAAWLLMPLLATTLFSPKVSPAGKVITVVSLTYSLVVWVYVNLLGNGKSNFLLYQISYFAMFHLAILATIILGINYPKLVTEQINPSGLATGTNDSSKDIVLSCTSSCNSIVKSGVSRVWGSSGEFTIQVGETQLNDDVNKYRESLGLGSLVIDSRLSISAQNKCNDMVKKSYWSHNAPDGTEPWKFIAAQSVIYKVAGENLAYGQVTGREVVNSWISSPEHNENLVKPKYTHEGFGICNAYNYNGSSRVTIVVQHLVGE